MNSQSLKITVVDDNAGRTDRHPTLRCTATGDTVFCGALWCHGSCGLPGLFLEGDLKARCSGTGVRAVWLHQTWNGERVYLPEEYRTDNFRNRYWFP